METVWLVVELCGRLRIKELFLIKIIILGGVYINFLGF